MKGLLEMRFIKKVIFILFAFGLVTCKNFDSVIKEGYFYECPNVSVRNLVDNFMGEPKWESFISPSDNQYYLNVSGEIIYDSRPASALLQFKFTEDNTSWIINAIEINGNPQVAEDINLFVSQMCNTYFSHEEYSGNDYDEFQVVNETKGCIIEGQYYWTDEINEFEVFVGPESWYGTYSNKVTENILSEASGLVVGNKLLNEYQNLEIGNIDLNCNLNMRTAWGEFSLEK